MFSIPANPKPYIQEKNQRHNPPARKPVKKQVIQEMIKSIKENQRLIEEYKKNENIST